MCRMAGYSEAAAVRSRRRQATSSVLSDMTSQNLPRDARRWVTPDPAKVT